MEQRALDRLDELIENGKTILESATRHGAETRIAFVTREPYRTPVSHSVDIQISSKWRTSCLNFLETQFGNDSRYYHSFQGASKQLSYGPVRLALVVLEAVKEDLHVRLVPRSIDTRGTLEDWAGSQHLSLGLLFTDIVKSTEIGRKRGDKKWINDLFKHFTKGREIASQFD